MGPGTRQGELQGRLDALEYEIERLNKLQENYLYPEINAAQAAPHFFPILGVAFSARGRSREILALSQAAGSRAPVCISCERPTSATPQPIVWAETPRLPSTLPPRQTALRSKTQSGAKGPVHVVTKTGTRMLKRPQSAPPQRPKTAPPRRLQQPQRPTSGHAGTTHEAPHSTDSGDLILAETPRTRTSIMARTPLTTRTAPDMPEVEYRLPLAERAPDSENAT